MRALGLLPWVLVAGCVHSATLREDAKLIQQRIATARERGAYRCAPRELAKAEAHLEFLRYELDEGDFRRAGWHHRAASENIAKALDVTDPEKCAEKQVVIQEAPVVLIEKQATDRDGDGFLDEVDQCPDDPEDKDGYQDDDGCPDLDNDGDGILDPTDQCPMEPEDYDAYRDEDGCPDPDNDDDTVLDVVDVCPLQPGPAENGGCPSQDRDGDTVTDDIDQCPDVPGKLPLGCPDRVLVHVTKDKIEIKEQINFELNKAIIKGELSFQILDQVGSVLKSNPQLKVVVEGHTDSTGNDRYNLELSDGRAHAVRQALVERGIAGDRLDAKGYGETKPIASNSTARGRAANRRVEFNIVQAAETSP